MNRRGSARSGVMFGVILVVVGSALLLERLDLLQTNLFRHFWPIVIACIGLSLLTGDRFSAVCVHGRVRDRGAGGKALGVLLIAIGAVLELQKWNIIHFRVWDLWPVYIIALGVFLLWRALRPPNPEIARNDLLDSRISEYAIFGGGEVRVTSGSFIGGNLTAVFGGFEIDFTNSRIAEGGPAVLYADAIFGGVSLRVPQTWQVTMHGPAIFGGVENKALKPAPTDEPEQHLIIKGMAIFGGIEIKN